MDDDHPTIRLLETHDVARQAGVTPAAIRRDAALGRLAAAAETSRGSLYAADDVERYLAERARRSRARYGAGGAE
jgi:hypothetical protein